MRRWVSPMLALLVMSTGGTAAAAELKSGLQVGESAPAYDVKDVTGPNKGKTLCYR